MESSHWMHEIFRGVQELLCGSYGTEAEGHGA